MKTTITISSSGKVALLIACNFISTLLLAADQLSPANRPMPEPGMRRDDGMGLDQRQQRLFHEALQKHHKDLTKFERQLHEAMAELVTATLAVNYHEHAARTKAEVIARIQVEMILCRCQALATVAPTLSAGQRENLSTSPAGSMLLTGGLLAPGERSVAPGGGPQRPADPLEENLFAPELVMRFQEQIGLTAEQRKAIMADLQQAQSKFAELHQELEKEKAALSALLKKERVELGPALAQADKLLDIEREVRRLQLALQVGLKNRLTPEQQQTLQDLKQQAAPAHGMGGEAPAAIQAKMMRLQTGMRRWQEDGRDPSVIGRTMRKFEPLMQAGQFEEAEAVLDNALQVLSEGKRPR